MSITKIRKRDGRIVDFDSSRINDAIHRAFIAVELWNGERAGNITEEIVKLLEKKFEKRVPSVEDAQDLVIEVLKKRGYKKVAEEYQVYREKKKEIRRLREKLGIEEPKLTVNALEVLRKRYLLRDETGRTVESPARMFRRVAKAIAKVDKEYGGNPKESEKVFYEMMARAEFLPNSPTLFNAGTVLGQLSACFVLPVKDSLESIFTAVKNMALIEKSGGGVGFDFSRLRPKGDMVKSTKGVASGPVSFMGVFDSATEVIKAGGKRRGAMMGALRADHPDIVEFITSKQKPGVLSNFNISVAVTDDFMKKLEEDGEYWLINPRNKEKVRKLKAKDVWKLMAKSAWGSGDPGVIFIDEINRHNPISEVGRIEATNPCLTGDTLVAVADGRNFVKIETLAKEGKDVPVYTWSGKKMTVRMGRNPRLTKKNTEVHRIYLDDNSFFDATSEHKLMLRDGSYKKVKDLKRNDALMPFWKIQYGAPNKRSMYWHVHQNQGIRHIAEHKLIMKYKLGRELREAEVVHHKDFNSLNNSWENLELMTESEHEKLHGERIKGKNNPYHQMSEDWKLKFASHPTDSNPMWGEKHCEETKRKIGRKTHERFKNMSKKELEEFSEKIKESMKKKVRQRISQKAKERWKGHRIISACPVCGKRFEHLKSRKRVCCSHACANKYRAQLKNHKVVRVGRLGRRNVYNLTVDEFHNFAIIGKNYISGRGNRKLSGITVSNCGEQPLLPYESCNLGSVNLSRMVEDGKVNWKKLGETVRNAVRFLDDVIDANRFPLKEIEEMTKANRKIGFGVMGFADMLIKLGVPYDSEEALALAEKIMKFVTDESREKSVELGEERGSFPNFDKSVWKDKYHGMRNATITTIAPTGSISIIAGCSSGIEPLFAISFIRKVLEDTRLFEINPLFEMTTKERGFYSAELLEEIARTGSVQNIGKVPEDVKRVFVTALDIQPEWHVRMQAAFQKYTDNAVSKTVNLPEDAAIGDVEKVFRLAYRLKCKGITIYRNRSRPEQVLNIGDIKTEKRKFVSAESEYAGGCPTKTCPFPN